MPFLLEIEKGIDFVQNVTSPSYQKKKKKGRYEVSLS